MPIAVSYPGVYIEEIPCGMHTITRVATSIAAFAGWAPKEVVLTRVMLHSENLA